ncbi:MAG: 50S ribosomal protein L10, partial [bacterium]|nr:50S ribosomal protein L10 [bacterium]
TVYQFGLANEKLKILGGFLEGKFKEAEEIIALAQLPTKEGLLAKLVGSIASPISGLINVLQGNIKGLITVLAKAKT